MTASRVRVLLLLALILPICQADSKERHDSKERDDDHDDKMMGHGPRRPPMGHGHREGKHHHRGRPGKHMDDDDWHSEGTIPTYQMTDVCGKTIEIDQHVSAFKLQIDWDDGKAHTNNMECGLNIRAPAGQRLMVKFLRMHFQDTNCQNYVEIYDGRTKISAAQPLLQKKCGSMMPADLTTTGQDAYVLFHSSNGSEKCEFLLMVTPFHMGECHFDEIVCDNHRCIDARLKCNGYDNCGDNSDNSYHLDCMRPSIGLRPYRLRWRKCIIGGIVTIVVIAIAVIVGVRCYRRRRALKLKGSAVDIKSKPGFLPTVSAADKKAIEAGLSNNWFVPPTQMVTPMAPPSYSEASGVPVLLTPPGTEEKEPLPMTAPMEEKPIV